MFCRFCGAENDDSYQHCKKCGKPLGFPEKQKEETKAMMVVEEPRQTTADISEYDRIVCPACGAGVEKCHPISKTEGKMKHGFSFWDGCCGMILLGPAGILCGLCGNSSTNVHTATWWICTQCGKEFISKQSALENAERAMKSAAIYTIILSLLLPFMWLDGGFIWAMIIDVLIILGIWASIVMSLEEAAGKEAEKLLSPAENEALYLKLFVCMLISMAAGIIFGIWAATS